MDGKKTTRANPVQKNQNFSGTYEGHPIIGAPAFANGPHTSIIDPLECARKVAAINALQLQMMPQTINCFWPQSNYSFGTPPWIEQNLNATTHPPPMQTRSDQSCFTGGIAPWLPPVPSPFLMGITCDGIPVRKNMRNSVLSAAGGEISDPVSNPPEKVDDGLGLISELSLGTLENSCSILSSDTCENLDSSIDADLFSLESFDLFSSDFDMFLNQLTNSSSESFLDQDIYQLKKRQVSSFLEPHVQIPRKRRSSRRTKQKSLSRKRLKSFCSFVR
eukprot:g3534.t1